MKVSVLEVRSNIKKAASIEQAALKDMPLKKDGWQFSWRSLFKTEGAEFFKLILLESVFEIEGIMMLTLMNDEMVFMNNIEVAPNNFGKQGKFDHVAGCLISFACMKSFEHGRRHYNGFLTFESKTELISLYEEKYGATLAMGQKMFIDPNAGLKLIEKYLKL